jgi:heme/copper-type cytochrome/quinol oxidase subunit 2
VETLPEIPAISVSAKANPLDAEQPPVSQGTAVSGTVASSLGSAVSDQLQQASTAIQPLSDAFTWAKYICLGITVICAGLAIYAVIKHRSTKDAMS